VIGLDARITGRRREEYFRVKLDQAMKETGIVVSLAAEVDGAFAGFLLCRVFYGEFGEMEAAAVLDTIGVHPGFRGRGVAAALLSQLRTNLLGLGIRRLATEVSWDAAGLVAFFRREGFRPAPRICIELDLEEHRERNAAAEAEAEAGAQ
jgi:ribosomal protein S18 acetylase RimI-like enzyme